ncbi:MAG TPA: hypothetical protein VL092_13935 [Chitinophagaceae bacterium]|nr:hypothetical protein [Chitinophagaceae bacterium]
MERYLLPEDIKVYCITASSFPDGVLAAHQQLHTLLPFSVERRYFGLSRPENGTIEYHAAAAELIPGELSDKGLKEILIPAGHYNMITVHNYMQHTAAIGEAFQQLIAVPGIDPQGYCVEWYITRESVHCMVRLQA